MIIVCTASADTYVTDKILNGEIRATDANVGRAGTLDLFRLYDETPLLSVTGQNELSRILIKFDLQPLYDLTGTILDINSSNFSAYMQLFDISSGNSTPANFNIIMFPLSQSFDEGVGKDVSAFSDLDRTNFITASYSNGSNILWFSSGANAGGLLGSNNIDYITSGNLGSGVIDLHTNQKFVIGNEDLYMNVTTVLSATLAGKIPNKGFRLSFSGTEEQDEKTRFVKRFASRHSSNALLRPRILVRFDDRLVDNSQNFNFDVSGTIFLENFVGSSYANIVSGSNLSEVKGNNCLTVTLNTGSFNFVVTGSQHKSGTDKLFVTGIYSASFAIPSNNASLTEGTKTLASAIAASGSVKFTTYWNSIDGTFGYHTGSLTINRISRSQGNFTTRKPMLRITNARHYYLSNDTFRFRVFGVDLDYQFNLPVKRPRKLTSVIYEKVYYQVVDKVTGKVVIPYDDSTNSTMLSTDSEGMFFDFKMQALPPGRVYGFSYLIVDRGISYTSSEDETSFEVRP